jgi:hypothetical protein
LDGTVGFVMLKSGFRDLKNSSWSWAKSIWFGVPILARIIVYICSVHWVGDLNLYSIHWLLGDLSVKPIWRSTITILHICKYLWCPLSWRPKYSFDMVYVDFLVAYYCLARTPEVLIPNLMQAEKVILWISMSKKWMLTSASFNWNFPKS